jgi:transglutaminase-like putative cysteine protease
MAITEQARRLLSAYSGEDAPPANSAEVPADVAAYLRATDGIDPHSPAIQSLAESLRGRTPVATITNVVRYLGRAVRYDLRQTSTDAQQVMERGAANCGGYTALFTALCRADGIPTREVWGLSRSYDRRTRHPRAKGNVWYADHAWAEVYLQGCGWVPIEPQGGTFRSPSLGCIRMGHYDPARGTYLKSNSIAMGAHPPAVEELAELPAEPAQ